jgi:hypothetical protein
MTLREKKMLEEALEGSANKIRLLTENKFLLSIFGQSTMHAWMNSLGPVCKIGNKVKSKTNLILNTAAAVLRQIKEGSNTLLYFSGALWLSRFFISLYRLN